MDSFIISELFSLFHNKKPKIWDFSGFFHLCARVRLQNVGFPLQ